MVIVAHGGLAGAYLNTLEHVLERSIPGAVAVAVEPDADAQSQWQRICDAISSVDNGQGVAVFTDVIGATPSRLAFDACSGRRTCVVEGVNIPMLIHFVKNRTGDLYDKVRGAEAAAKKYIKIRQPM